MTTPENQPEINGFSQSEIINLMERAVAFVDGCSIGRYTSRSMTMWLNKKGPFVELGSARDDVDLAHAFYSSGFLRFCKTMEPVFAYRALVDEESEAFSLFEDISHIGGFDENSSVKVDSGIQSEVNRYLTMATLFSLPVDAFEEGTMTHMRLDNFLGELKRTCENPKQAFALDNVLGEFLKFYHLEGDESAAYYFEECSPLERATIRDAMLSMDGIILKAPLLYGSSYSSDYSITFDAFDDDRKADENMAEQEMELIDFIEPYMEYGAVKYFKRAGGSSNKGSMSSTFNIKASRGVAQDIADEFPGAKVVTKTGARICSMS